VLRGERSGKPVLLDNVVAEGIISVLSAAMLRARGMPSSFRRWVVVLVAAVLGVGSELLSERCSGD
jgi:hypothetical protein